MLGKGEAANLGLGDDLFGTSSLAAPRPFIHQSRARIIENDAAFLDDLDLDSLKAESAKSIMRESRGAVPSLAEETTHDKFTSVSRQLQLALSSSTLRHQNSDDDIPESPPIKSMLRSTGTTIVGCLVEEGRYVILGADTRATDDRMVADKDCEKIHCIAPNVWCCGAGTSADLEATTRLAQYTMALEALQELSIGNIQSDKDKTAALKQDGGILLQPVSVSAACRFLRNTCYSGGGSLGVNLILGGYDIEANEGRLTAIHPHGSMDVVPFAALGSGGLAAMAVLESRYRPNLTREEGVELVKRAVLAGIENDLGSGSQVDMCVLGPGGSVDYRQGVVPEQELEKATEDDESIDEAILSDSKTSRGVNGFGNLPFAVNSRRAIASQHDEATRIEKWNSLLGLQ